MGIMRKKMTSEEAAISVEKAGRPQRLEPPVDGPSPGGNYLGSTTSGHVLVETELLVPPVDLVLVETAGTNLVSVGLSWYRTHHS